MNTPYVKKYNESGEIINPIGQTYIINHFPNRRARRETRERKWGTKPKQRFRGNGKNIPLSIIGGSKYLRHIQIIFCEDGSEKRIEHYLLKGKNW